jgi:hypothetical protein
MEVFFSVHSSRSCW